MMPTAGTFTLDGLIQGPAPDPDALRAWVKAAAKSALGFNLELDGGQFSLLADDTTRNISSVGAAGLEATLTTALEALMALYPAGRATLYSTLRSREFRPGLEIQTLYAINNDGSITAQTREVEADIAAPPVPPGKRGILLQSCAVLAALLILGFASLFVVNWRELLQRSRLMASPEQGVELDASALAPYFTAKLGSVKQIDGFLKIEIARGDGWDTANPTSLDEPLPSEAQKMNWRNFLALSAAKRGSARCCFYDEKGNYTGETNVPLEALNTVEKLTVEAAIPRSRALLKRIVLKP